MPALPRPQNPNTITIPSRKAIVAGDTDVLVVGAGPAGLGAAIAASRCGAKVILTEQYGFVGGNATAALVIPWMSYFTQIPVSEKPGAATLFPTDHGHGDPVVGGIAQEFVLRLVARGGAVEPCFDTGYVTTFDPEIFKIVALDMLEEHNVSLLFHAFASDALCDGSVKGVVFETKSGPVVVNAKIVIDCTGDGDIAARAGAPFEVGRIEDGKVQPMTLMFRMGEFERQAFAAYAIAHPSQWSGVHGLWDLVKKAHQAGELDLGRENILFFGTPRKKEIAVNSTRIIEVLGTDVWDLTKAEIVGRHQMRQIVTFLKRYVPGFEKSYILQSGTTVGVRESRRIMGLYKLTTHDVLEARKFEDVIARCAYPIDIHNPLGKGTIMKNLPPGESYDIPLRCLIPQKIESLLIAGRCISGTHQAHSSFRCMPTAMATGQAAGTCAAIAAQTQLAPRHVNFEDVQDELLKQGANLGRHKTLY